MKSFLPFVLLLLALAGCRKDPALYDPVFVGAINLNDAFGERAGRVDLGAGYGMQAYYSLVDDRLVGVNDRYAWDVALEVGEEPVFFLNSAIPGLRVARTFADWEAPVEPDGLEWLYDLPGGRDADWAIGRDWEGEVLLIDRGLDAAGAPRGLKKVQVSVAADGSYALRVASVNNAGEVVFGAVPDTAFNAVMWSLDAGAVGVEPPKGEWDLVFTNYLHVYEPETNPFPYQVTGALLNPSHGRGARLEDTPLEAAALAPLTDARDAVGFDWKRYDFELGYVVVEDLSFLVECADGGVRALAFTGFADEAGEPGSPAFTYRLLPE